MKTTQSKALDLKRKTELERKIKKIKQDICKEKLSKNNPSQHKKKRINKQYALEQKGYRIIAFTEAPSKIEALESLQQFQILNPEEYRVIECK